MLVGLQMLMLQRGRTDGTLREHKHGVARERLGGLELFFDVWAAHRDPCARMQLQRRRAVTAFRAVHVLDVTVRSARGKSGKIAWN